VNVSQQPNPLLSRMSRVSGYQWEAQPGQAQLQGQMIHQGHFHRLPPSPNLWVIPGMIGVDLSSPSVFSLHTRDQIWHKSMEMIQEAHQSSRATLPSATLDASSCISSAAPPPATTSAPGQANHSSPHQKNTATVQVRHVVPKHLTNYRSVWHV